MAAPIEIVLYAANVTIKLQIIIQTRKKTTAATTTPTTTSSSSTTTTIELTLESAFHAIPYSIFHSMPALVGFFIALPVINGILKSYCTAETVVINLVAETRMQQRWSCVSLPILKDAYRNWPHKIHQYQLVVRAEFKSVINTKTSL